jgi:hypothetical protein
MAMNQRVKAGAATASCAAAWRQAADLALEPEDEFGRLQEAHLAQACLNGLLSPLGLPEQPEDFSMRPDELRALLRVLQVEMERRAGVVGEAIGALRLARQAPSGRPEVA